MRVTDGSSYVRVAVDEATDALRVSSMGQSMASVRGRAAQTWSSAAPLASRWTRAAAGSA